MANIITGVRIALGAALLIFPPLSVPFYILFALAGLSDMTDGVVARKTNKASRFGSLFDSAADFVLFAACFIKLLPVLKLELWTVIWISAVALIKVINALSGIIMRKKLIALHTAANKAVGVLLFALPFTLRFIDFKYSAPLVLAAATFAAVQEGHFIRTGGHDD